MVGIVAVAQTQTNPVVKVLPSTQGHLKVLFVDEHPAQNIEVIFYEKGQVIKKDRIKGDKISKGFLKRYDLSKVRPGDYWVEISTDDTVTKYKFTTYEERPLWVSWWGTFLPSRKVIASK